MHVLVKQNKVEEALSVAEKERKRAIVDIFLEEGSLSSSVTECWITKGAVSDP